MFSDTELLVVIALCALGVGLVVGLSLSNWAWQKKTREAASQLPVRETAPPDATQQVRVSASASVRIDRPTADIWAFVEAPESNLLTNPDGQHAVRLPGTGPGVGEIQVFVSHGEDCAGKVSALKVTEHTAGQHAAYEHLGDGYRSGGSVELSGPAEGPVTLLQTAWLEIQVPVGTPDQALEPSRVALQGALRESLTTTKRLLESGVAAPSVDRD